jgi:uncharacterized repeat protein (TIGR01451 family)
MQPNVPVDWALYDDRDVLLGGGADVTSEDGFISFEGQAAAVLAGYTGRVKVVASASTPDGPIADTALTAAGFGRGVFGAVAHASDGIVTVMPLDDPAAAVQTDVVNGAFGVPAFAARRGRFVAAFRDPSGNATVRQFSKDASDYFVLIAPSGATADLGIAIRPSRRNVRRGSTVSYAVSLTNAGPDSASGVVATVTLPDGIDLVDLPRGCDGPMPGVVRCALVSLGPGTRVGLIVLGRVEASPRRVLSTTAVVRGNGTDPVASNDESTASIRVVGRP